MKVRSLLFLLIITSVLGVALVSCRPVSDDSTATDTPAAAAESTAEVAETEQEVEETPAQPAEPTAPAGPPESFTGFDYETTDSGLQVAIVEEGSGARPEEGDVVRVNYAGTLGDGSEFDSSYSRGEPIQFALGRGQVIPGWDEGLSLLSPGAKAKLIIPPDLAYGEQGAGGVIPPNATLYFDVELLEVLAGGPDEPTAVDEADFTSTESGLKYYTLEDGDGETPSEGQPVRVDFTAWLEDGTRIDSTIDRGEPLTFTPGSGQVFPGLEEGVRDMSVGERRQLLIPPELAFGEAGSGPIPPDASVVFEVELLELLPTGPEEPTAVEESDYKSTENGVQYYDLEVGDGEVVETGQTVSVNYVGWLAEDGTKFDSSYQRGQPIVFTIGGQQVIPGWDEGIVGMREGGRRQLLIPPEMAYGEQGAGASIPPNASLIFEVQVQEIVN